MGTRLAGKVAIVFGAGSVSEEIGNGKATAILYAREGARIMAVDVNLDAARSTMEVIRGEGNQCSAYAADITVAAEVRSAVEACMKEFGRIDILHNNVGNAFFGGPVDTEEDCWDKGIDMNLKGVYLTCKYVLPIMEAQRSGAIVNISSLAGSRWVGVPYISYSSAKAGVNQFTVVVAMQYANKGIRANVVAPGLIDSGHVRDKFRQKGEDVTRIMAERDAQCPTGKMGDPWDVAYASLFLASDEAKYVTGIVLPVDGGIMCQCTSPR
jgi:NAD(P)-dependent dehydrogenase (short-subunit alcohol dehydrogenase family)